MERGLTRAVRLRTMTGVTVEADLQDAIRASNMSYRRIAKRAGISHVAIIRFMRGGGVQTYTLKALARVLGYTITLVPPAGQERPSPNASGRPSARALPSPQPPQQDRSETSPA